ncbi:MAG: 3-methyl-2-oxobutanoate hydroxymethyltransferase, partial [Fimbriimonadales bacterium]|nr:3-methyl-2-oxobutanoate hydroxymethyltransferase [Fimbriimonadales bacterium]
VMAHLGLTPQSVHQFGGYRLQGRTPSEQEALLQAAHAVQDAGAFSLVLEVIPASLALRITASVQIPTIGIGAGVHCDGEIQVWHDILGLSERQFRHTKRYANLRATIEAALRQYAQEVRDCQFPAPEHSFEVEP